MQLPPEFISVPTLDVFSSRIMQLEYVYWSRIINLIVQTYLKETTICVLWQDGLQFDLHPVANPLANDESYVVIVNINVETVQSSLVHNALDFESKAKQLRDSGLDYDALILKLTLSIEVLHCESFIVPDAHLEDFARAFTRASMYSIWRSTRNKFIFFYNKDAVNETRLTDYFFQDQPNILYIESVYENASAFELKTNKYVGPRADGPEQMQLVDRYDAELGVFEYGQQLFVDKTHNLQGRELIIATFDYRPYSVFKYDTTPNVRDLGASLPNRSLLYIDGTETRVVMAFCERFNCTVTLDTSEADDWGTIYPNMSGDGAMGMIIKHKADVCIGAMYSWYDDYIYLDMSMYLVRSGITCLVPTARPQASWLLPLQPFQALLWAAVLSCLFVEFLSLVCTYKSEQFFFAHDNDSWLESVKFGAVTTFKLFISQGGNRYVNSMTVRVLLFACFLNDIIITSIYGGGLASILTIPSLEETVDTLKRLRSHKLQWAANSEAWVSAIRASDDPIIIDILENFHIYTDKKLYELAHSITRMGFTLERLQFGHFAIEDYLTTEAISHMKIMQEDIYFQYTVAFVPRLWPLLARFNQLVYNWHSSGFDKYWEYRVVADNLNVHKQQQVEASMLINWDAIGPLKLAMSNFVGILLVWVLGITLAIFIFLAELALAKWRPSKETPNPV